MPMHVRRIAHDQLRLRRPADLDKARVAVDRGQAHVAGVAGQLLPGK